VEELDNWISSELQNMSKNSDSIHENKTTEAFHNEMKSDNEMKSEDDVIVTSSTLPDTANLDGDEALELVGTSKKDSFSDEYNAKLRRKLDLIIPPICAMVYFTQFLDKNTLAYAR
jgi:ACS family allantoate permease-like MFS transporter